MKPWTRKRQYLFAVAAGLIYGVGLRVLLHWPYFGTINEPRNSRWFPNDLWVMSFGFLIIAPMVVGWITVSSTPSDGVMRSLQDSILDVVKHRCERESRQDSARLNP